MTSKSELWAFWYTVLLFLSNYIFNVLVTGPNNNILPDVNLYHKWFRFGGLVNFRNDMGGSARALGEQALILSIMAFLLVAQQLLSGTKLPSAGVWYYRIIADVLQRACRLLQAINQQETSMIVTLGFIVAMFHCEEGRASLLTLTYVALLAWLIGTPGSEYWLNCRRNSWLALHALAELASIFVMFVYVMGSAVEVILTGYWKVITVATCTHLTGLMLPHVGIFVIAGLQYTVLSESTYLKPTMTMQRSRRLRWHVLSKFGIKGVKILRRRLKKVFEECMFLVVMNLAVITSLLPPTDIHSMALLGLVGPSLLLHNMERPPKCCSKNQSREWHELRALRITQYLALACLLLRTVCTSAIWPMPKDDLWVITMEELGLKQNLQDTSKYIFIGCTSILARLAANMLSESMSQEMATASSDDPMKDIRDCMFEIETSPEGADEPIPTEREEKSIRGGPWLADTPPSAKLTEPMAESSSMPECNSTPVPAPARPRSVEDSELDDDSMPPSMFRTSTTRPEDRFLTKWAPSWMPVQAHSYLSICLLFTAFIVSDTENHLLNFLMMLAVVMLCGWHKQWVRAGDVFASTSVLIMIVQYAFRFRRLQSTMDEAWIDQVGLRWTSKQVVRHYCILVLCFLQKDFYFRGRNSKAREATCPPWVARHADIVGIFVLLLVAVARRHAWAAVMATAVIPWLVYEDPAYTELRKKETSNASRTMWLLFFRVILLSLLLLQLLIRLGKSFGLADALDGFFNGICKELWDQDRLADCRAEWHAWTKITGFEDAQLFWDFLALFILGYIQQLLPHQHRASEEETEEDEHIKHRWKLVTMYWWPCVVWVPLFILSLEGGSLLGLVFLILLLAVIFSSDGPLHQRKRWVWRARFIAWVFLVFGLWVQSPGIPCSVASCKNDRHDTFVPKDECSLLESYPSEVVATEAQMRECESGGVAWGHDTPMTLLLRVVGMRRVQGTGFVGGLWVLFGSQLGALLLVICTTTIQLRIYSSPEYGDNLEETFIIEPPRVRYERALRFVHEFHCGGYLEKQAQQQRHRALRSKLKRIMKQVSRILGRDLQGELTPPPKPGSGSAQASFAGGGSTPGSATSKSRSFTDRSRLAVEEVHLLHGVNTKTADEVCQLFLDHVDLSSEYLQLLDKVAVGRVQPHGEFMTRCLVDLAKSLKARVKEEEDVRSRCESCTGDPQQGNEMEEPAEAEAETSNKCTKNCISCLRLLMNFYRKSKNMILEWWDWFKCSPFLASLMWDYAWLGAVEMNFHIKSWDKIAKEEMHEHRTDNGPLRLLWKLCLSHSASLVAAASVVGFIETRCVLDFLRVLLVFFIALRTNPSPPSNFWTVLKVYSTALLIVRTMYNFPNFCSGMGARHIIEEESFDWEPKIVFGWCPPILGWTFDVTLGIAKRVGPSALHAQSWLSVVWADHLCIFFIVAHQWMLTRTGLWENVTVDEATRQLLVKPEMMKEISTKEKEE